MLQNAPVAVAVEQRPVRLVVRNGDLARSRLTVLFRLFLAIPHFAWLTLWGIAAFVVAFILWLAVLIEGKAPKTLHDFVAGYVRYATHVASYVLLAANPYPGFRGAPGYAVDVEIDLPVRQGRWAGFFRLILALPALLLTSALGGGFSSESPGQSSSWRWLGGGDEQVAWFAVSAGGAASAAAFLAWFAILARGSAPRGLRDLTAFAIGYGAQAGAYLLLLTPRYPTSDPKLAEPYAELPEHPVRIVVTDDLDRPRLTVLFRVFLVIPHLVWLALWSVAAFFAVMTAWVIGLATGRVPPAIHRFLAAYVRYATHVVAFLYLVGRRFPGFTGRAGSYGIDVEIAPPDRQSRWKILLRFFLAIPALILGGALGSVALVVGFLGWWFALARGEMPEGLRNLGASCLRFNAQTYAYLGLLTDRYPCAAPVLERPQTELVEWPDPFAFTGDAF